MPGNPSRLRGRRAEAFVAVAGPAMNLLIAIACVVLFAGWNVLIASPVGANFPDHVRSNVQDVFWAGALLNVVLILFNMIPIPPLDGSKIVADFSPGYARLFDGPQGQYLGLGLFIAMWLFGFGKLFEIAAMIVRSAITVLMMPFV